MQPLAALADEQASLRNSNLATKRDDPKNVSACLI